MVSKNQKYMLLFFIILQISFRASSISIVHYTNLTGQWQLKINSCPKQQFNNMILNVTIPTVLHLDLQYEGKIPDPFFGDNYRKVQWISSCNVTYSKNFTLEDSSQNVELVFEGIDTYSTIKFNGLSKLTTNNSFVEYRIKINKQQRKPLNLLEIEVYSTKSFDDAANRKNPMPFIYAHSRKAAYQYSWDWAPYLNTMGIWKPVYVSYYEDLKFDYVWVRNKQVRKKKAVLNFAIALNLGEGSSFSQLSNRYKVVIAHNQTEYSSKQVKSKHVYIDVQILEPRLWWPNGIGEPNIYDFEVKIIRIVDSRLVDIRKVPFGIRTVQLNQDQKKFTVHINGYPIYCKGANYVPTDMFYPRNTNSKYIPGYTFQKLLNDTVQSHFNMIRVWGGGQYESQQFLELASRKGIMIFYDFMFSDSIYPSTKQFLQNVEVQITQQVRKARNYPCLALWSGNNQIYQGILSWGWSRENYQRDFQRLFKETIPAILQKQNPDIPYISSSPVNGVGNSGFDRGGDVHYWGVWAGGALFDAYKNAIGPFNSQFGTQSIPVWQTVISFTQQAHRTYTGSQFAAHQRHNSQFNTLNRYIKTYAHESKNFEYEAYLSGLIQAFGIQIAIKYQRISKPKSFGTLYWQLNDAWPAISWSSIDYYGRWKPLQYMAKRLYPDVAVFFADGKIIAVNDNLYELQAVVIIKIQNFNGNTVYNKTIPISLLDNQVKVIEQIQPNNYKEQLNQIILYTQIISGREKQMSSTYCFANFKQLKIHPDVKLYVQIVQDYNILKLRADKVIKNLYISSISQYIKLSDNYFDMIAHKTYVVVLDEKHSLGKIKDKLRFRSYVQIHSSIQITVVYQ